MEIHENSYEWSYPLSPRRSCGLIFLCREGVSGFSAADAHYCHRMRGDAGIAYHYYVRESGLIERGRPESSSAGLDADFDAECVAICFEGERSAPLTAAQFGSGRELIHNIIARFPGISIKSRDVSEPIYATEETLN